MENFIQQNNYTTFLNNKTKKMGNEIPQEIMKKIEAEYSSGLDYQIKYLRQAAIFGYSLRDKEVEELKKEIQIAKAAAYEELFEKYDKLNPAIKQNFKGV